MGWYAHLARTHIYLAGTLRSATVPFCLLADQVVEEARRRLLKQHGAAVEGYLPKGALKSRDELEYVRDLSRRRQTNTNGNQSDAGGRNMAASVPGSAGAGR